MARLEITLLGAFQVSKDGKRVTRFETAPARALLIYLVLHPEMPFRREVLADLLWRDQPRSEALHALRQTLNRLRRAIESRESNPPFLQVTRQTIQFNSDSDYWLDTDVFTDLADAAQAHPHRRLEACDTCVQQLTQAADLYRGDLLSGFYLDSLPFQEWLTMEREHFHRRAMETFYYLADCHNQRREYRQAQHYARRQLELEPWREEAHRQLMVALSLSGHRSAALAQYEACRRILLEELGVEPEVETRTLSEQIRDGNLRASEIPPHNLPAQLTRFVGRETELEQIAAQLNDPTHRLLTLIGSGGIGKTRLALQAAGKALDVFADGVYFVPLAGISSPEFLVPTIGEALDYPLSGKADPKRQLLNYLHQKEMLLVLDNFEHLLSSPGGNSGGRDLLLEIAKMAPRLKLLITSRERLNLKAEWLLTLQGLPYPPAETAFGEETFEAIELFVQSAHRVRPDFTLSAEWPDVVRICRLLEGMPLGIELAATWVSVMPCVEIARELSRGLDLLSTTLHDVPDRHKSLEAVFDHSWQLLSEPERAVFKKLSVFRGGFDRRAAEQVAGASLSTLAVLVNKSLLQVVSPGRYDMLEPLKQYTAAKLAETPAEDEGVQNRHCDHYASPPSKVRQRHARYYLSLAEQAEQALKGPKQLVWLGRMETESDNLRTALGWTLAGQGERAALGLKLAGTLGLFWQMYSHHWSEGYRWLKAALENSDGASASMRAKALLAAGTLLFHQWRFEQAVPFFQESLTLYQKLDDKGGIADALYWLGCHAFRQKEYYEATRLLEKSLVLYREGNDQYGISMALRNLGDCARLLKDYERSSRLYEQGLALSRKIGNKRGASNALNSLGELARLQGNLKKAKAFYEENLSIARELGNELSQAISLHNLGHATLRLGDLWGAQAQFKESVSLFQKLEHTRGITLCLAGLGGVASSAGQAERAAKLLGIAKTALEASNVPLPLGPADQAAYDRYLAATKAQLDPQVFAAAWEVGRRMTLSQAVACALEQSPEDSPNS